MDVVLKGWDQGAINLNPVSSTCGARPAAAVMGVIMLEEIHNREDQGAIGQEPILSRLQISPEKQGRPFLSLITNLSFYA